MPASTIRWRSVASLALALSFAFVLSPGAYAQKKPKIIKAKPEKTADQPSVEPDKVLYDRAMADIKRGHFLESRLNLQTLINTYPDSEYLAKAKLAVADSYFKEGGTGNMTQAIEEYKNFIVFFPFLDEAAYAQMQVAMAHYHMMEKTDRDNSQALAAESELQVFLQKYPASPLHAKAEQSLREVQEVLADGEFRVGKFYYVRARNNPVDYSAAAARLIEVSERYPLYSESDEALWMLGEIYERVKTLSKNEDDKNHWNELAARCYDRIATEYPLSKLAPSAKARLQEMGRTPPAANPAALARMEKNREYQKTHHTSILTSPASAIRVSPGVTAASRAGEPTLNAADDAVSATDALKQGATGPLFGADLARANAESENNNNPPSATPTIVEGGIDSVSGGTGATAAVQILEAPSGPPADSTAAPAAEAPSSPSSSSSSSSGVPAAAASAPTPTDSSAAPATKASDAAPGTTSGTAPAAATGDASSSSTAAQPSAAPAGDTSKESTSKKKKGLHKLNPF